MVGVGLVADQRVEGHGGVSGGKKRGGQAMLDRAAQGEFAVRLILSAYLIYPIWTLSAPRVTLVVQAAPGG
jgi:hypothetical protein